MYFIPKIITFTAYHRKVPKYTELFHVVFLHIVLESMEHFNSDTLMKKIIILPLFLSLFVSTFTLAKQTFKPSDPAWSFSGQDVTTETIDGVEGIKIGRGQALLKELSVENGTIEFNMYMPQERAFAYLYFRGQSEQEFEEIYLRTHKSKAPDALQYAPVFQRRAAWQLYHGENGTAAANFPANQWVPVKVKLQGPKLQVWIGDMNEPIMTVNKMGRKPQSGWLGFRGFVPSTSDAKFSAYFSAITVTPDEMNENIPEMQSPKLSAGHITKWRVSRAFESKPGPIESIPQEILAADWIEPIMQDDGSFELLRSIEVPKGVRHWSAVAQVALHADKAQTCKLHFGFSDQVTLSLNGKQILYQDARYRFDKPRRQGLMYQDQIVVYLPLDKGKNSLQAVISDNFGGWGLIGKLEQCKGVEIR